MFNFIRSDDRSSRIRYRVERKVTKTEGPKTRNYPKPGAIYHFDKSGKLAYIQRAVAKFLPSSPRVNGVRMRYENGRLVPRVAA